MKTDKGPPGITFGYRGLTDTEVKLSRTKHGSNRMSKHRSGAVRLIIDLVKEPMVLLLVAACAIYFITGKYGDAAFMLCAIGVTISISLYQDYRSRKALTALEALTEPECRVIRNGSIIRISKLDVVIGDLLLAEEGAAIPADGVILHSNDFSVNEAILTGESLPVIKDSSDGSNRVLQGTSVASGLAICEVNAIGESTTFGAIGRSLEAIEREETPLQKQIRSFVRKMALIGIAFFAGVLALNFARSSNFLDSLLKSLSLAMSILPEEIPVAFTTFMVIGAWRLSKLGIIVKHTNTIETLGRATVICIDKTGTITKNQMELLAVYSAGTRHLDKPGTDTSDLNDVVRIAMWASEPIPFDPMELALHDAYSKHAPADERTTFRMIHEYPLGGHPPVMTHIFEDNMGVRIVAAKGAPEGILAACKLQESDVADLKKTIDQLSSKGARILGVAKGNFSGNDFPKDQLDIPFTFVGLVAFYDPPKDNMSSVIQAFYQAGISVKIITGDHPQTAAAIARQINFVQGESAVVGKELLKMTEEQVQKTVETTNIFARMFPESKLRILNALKKNGHVVAMTGDGVNDAPALKAAHIGIAMGKRGTEVAKEVSSLILSDDDLAKMIDAIAAGRKIYSNLKKAIQYIISIHIPIILTVFVPLVLGWIYPTIFTPVHVIFLELVMGPTCSIIYENEPLEKSLMHQRPRPITRTFFNARELFLSIIQGIVISAGALIMYQYSIMNSYDEQLTRSMVFATIISANIGLTLVNRSSLNPIWVSIRYRNRLVPLIISITLLSAALILYIHPVAAFFQVRPLPLQQVLLCAGTGLVSVVWIEAIKLARIGLRRQS